MSLYATMLMVVLAVPAFAGERRVEVFAVGGVTALNVKEAVDDVCDGVPCPSFHLRGRLEKSPLAGLAAAYEITPGSHVEVALSLAPSRHFDLRAEADVFVVPIEVERELATYHVTASFRRSFGGERRVRPFILVGVGRVQYAARDDLRLRAPAGDWAIPVGVGVTLGGGRRTAARLDVVDHLIPDHFMGDGLKHDVHVRAGVMLRF